MLLYHAHVGGVLSENRGDLFGFLFKPRRGDVTPATPTPKRMLTWIADDITVPADDGPAQIQTAPCRTCRESTTILLIILPLVNSIVTNFGSFSMSL